MQRNGGSEIWREEVLATIGWWGLLGRRPLLVMLVMKRRESEWGRRLLDGAEGGDRRL